MKHIFSFSKNKEKKELSSAKRLFIGSSLIILSLFLFISFVSYFFTGEIDQSNLAEFTDISISNSNSLGKIGAIISDFFIYRGFGVSSIIFSFLVFISALKVLLDLKKRNITKNWLWGFYLIFLFSIFFGVVDNGNIYSGIIGYEIVNFLDIYISYLGIIFLLIFMSLVYLTFRLKFGVNDVLKILKYFNKSAKVDMDSILIYDEQIIKLSEPIHKCRKKFVNEFIPIVIEKYNNISGKNEKVTLDYRSDLNDNNVSDLLKKSFQKDMILQFTSCGIHKDDLIFKIDNNSIKKFGSQGQQKSFLISLRFAEFEFLKNNNNLSPILLMDDIFDKLDIERVKNIVDLVNSSEFGQLFVSDTDKTRIEKVLKSLKNSSKIFEI